MATEFFERRKLTGSINITLSNGQKWHKDKAELCSQIEGIVERYSDSGYTLTLRQLYYQLVAADMIRNDDKVYKKISGVLDDLKYSGNIDWEAIEDRGRVPYMPFTTSGIPSAMDAIIYSYKLRRIEDQDKVIEVWTEKDAISGILKKITSKYTVNLVVNKGYSSSTAMYSAYNRIIEAWNQDKGFEILYFGDHDPSGLDMIRDIAERLVFMLARGDNSDLCDEYFDQYWTDEVNEEFDADDLVELGYIKQEIWDNFDGDNDAHQQAYFLAKTRYALQQSGKLKITPLGLTMEQIRAFNPPENPAKISDPRAKWYVEKFGGKSWEVDALSPEIMEGIVENGILDSIDESKYKAKLVQEDIDKKSMRAFANKMK